jgi:hypothetical protein
MAVSTAQVTPRSEDVPSFPEVVIAYLTDTVARKASSFDRYSSFTQQFVCHSCGVSLVEMEMCALNIFLLSNGLIFICPVYKLKVTASRSFHLPDVCRRPEQLLYDMASQSS